MTNVERISSNIPVVLSYSSEDGGLIGVVGMQEPLVTMDMLPYQVYTVIIIDNARDLGKYLRDDGVFDLDGNRARIGAIALRTNILPPDLVKRRLQLVSMQDRVLPDGVVIFQDETNSQEINDERERIFGEPTRRIHYRELQTGKEGEIVVYQNPSSF